MLIELIDARFGVKGKLLLNDVSIRINEGDKIGIVGRNGCGKSTLLAILSGSTALMGGTIKKNKKAKIMLVKQELPTDERSVLDWLVSVDQDLIQLKKESEEASEEDFGDITSHIAEIEEERYEKLAPQVLLGLGLSTAECHSPMKNLSGGFCMRISLAAALIQQPDLLLLDEPTNHLDLESTLWLIEFLKTYPKAYAIVSHGTDFLNQLTTKTWALQKGTLTSWGGNYDVFIRESEIKKEADLKNNIAIDKDIARAQRFIDVWGEHQSTASLAQSREKLKIKLEKRRIEIVPEEKDIPISFPEAPLLHDPIIKMEGVSAGYAEKIILNDINFILSRNARIGLLGRNGQGKSTFAKLLADRLECKAIIRRTGLRIGYFSQNQTDELNVNLSVFDQLKVSTRITEDDAVRSQLGRFGFDHKKWTCKVGKLSGGEKSRLFFAIIAAQNPHLIILDEPTNHLDINSRQALIKAINEFSGAVILVTHDWDLHHRTMRDYFLVRKGKVLPYTKGLDHYKRQLLSQIAKLSHHPAIAFVKSELKRTLEEKIEIETEGKEEKVERKEMPKTAKPLAEEVEEGKEEKVERPKKVLAKPPTEEVEEKEKKVECRTAMPKRAAKNERSSSHSSSYRPAGLFNRTSTSSTASSSMRPK